ncbi:hypothetical protein JANAI62_12160 [Jannaschia pagri]|uniref:DUF1800 domain-containing protein n=1 Tax=Jannaschia pagri TaxID=2829797 RepID=A0ABQ4NJJ3_9RHOB|nr:MULTISPECIES: DUF1800 domain-containing protein [unclassified Jannaschia]GIT90761.1 hypothetical protein JANAI61_12190 [Jannaschia sp. AI_61]GIT94593.1 hypothetical protein JANAI62_12160 [Jannaschia sp. AI_62]
MTLSPTLAAVRFGTGLSPQVPAPRGASDMLDRLAGPDHMAQRFPQPGWDVRVAGVMQWIRLRQNRKNGDAAVDAFREHARVFNAGYHADLARIVARAARTEDGFRERLAWFWADHFTVSEGQGRLRKTISGYTEDAVRPYITGRFGDLLVSAVMHPAMVSYLDQDRSVGPGSRRGQRGGGLNENLAREVLELHTLGVGGSYTQSDVRQLAELLTGLTVTKEGLPHFQPNSAEPGAEIVLGRSYGQERAADSGAIVRVLQDLAVHPDTARHLSAKLARHFLADTPPDGLVQAMAVRWIATDGDLLSVYGVLLDHPVSAEPTLRKVRRPLEFVAAATRALGPVDRLPEQGNRLIRTMLINPMRLMGQPLQRAPGPDGWPEAAEAWVTPQTLAARIQWGMDLAGRWPNLPDPRAFVDTALADLASPRTRFAAQAAEDRRSGIGLILSSPEFQRR